MSEIKILTTPFSIISNPKELLYHTVFSRLLSSSKKLRKFKKISLDYLDYKFKISSLDSDIKDKFDGLEVNMFYHGLFSSKGKLNHKKIQLIKEKFPQIYAVHGNYELPIGSYGEHRLNLAKELDKEKTKLFLANIDCANELMKDNKHDFKPIVLHAGYGDRKNGLDNVIKNIAFALEYVEKKNYKIDLLLENLPKDNEEYITTNSEDLLYIKNNLSSNSDIYNFGFCFDFGHANSAGIIEGENNNNFRRQHELIDSLGRWIKHTHLNYNECHKINRAEIYNYKNFSELDWHAPFPLNDVDENNEIENILKKLKNKTSIVEKGLVTLEIFPKYYFPHSKNMKIEAFSHGYEKKDIVEKNIEFIRDSLK